MALTTTKTKKTRGSPIAATPAKRTSRAGNKKKAPVNSKQGNLNKDNVDSQKLDVLMESMSALSGKMQDLSGRVDAAEEWQKDADMFPASHHTSCTARRRAMPRGPPTLTTKW